MYLSCHEACHAFSFYLLANKFNETVCSTMLSIGCIIERERVEARSENLAQDNQFRMVIYANWGQKCIEFVLRFSYLFVMLEISQLDHLS